MSDLKLIAKVWWSDVKQTLGKKIFAKSVPDKWGKGWIFVFLFLSTGGTLTEQNISQGDLNKELLLPTSIS